MNWTPCRLRLLATKVAPSTSAMDFLLSEWGRLDDPVGPELRWRPPEPESSPEEELTSDPLARKRHPRWRRRQRFANSPLPGEIAPAVPARKRGVVEDIAPHRRGLEGRARRVDL